MDARKLFGNVLIPIAYFVRGDLRYAHYRRYMGHLSFTRTQMEAYRDERLRRLVGHAYATVPYYRRLLDEAGISPTDIRTAEDLKKLPVLTKDMIREHFSSLVSSLPYATTKVSSGGSTGNSVTILKDKRYSEISRAVHLRDLTRAGIKPGEKIAWVWASSNENRDLGKNLLHRALWRINRRIIFNSYKYSKEDLRTWLTGELASFKPDHLYGYANSILEIAEFIEKEKITIPRIKSIVTTAQKLEKREYIEKVFKCKVIDHYGCREVITIAIEEGGRMTCSDDFVIPEVLDDGRIVLTPLESYAMPLLRYAIGDMGEQSQKKKGDSSAFSPFNITVGRVCEMLKARGGKKLYPGAINLKVADEGLRVGEFQLIQRTYDLVEIKVVKGSGAKKTDIIRLKNVVKDILGTKKIIITEVKEYPVEKSGKKISYKCLIP